MLIKPQTVQIGDRVKVTKVMFAEGSTCEIDSHYTSLLHEKGWVIQADGSTCQVLLDNFTDEGYKVFFEEELTILERKGEPMAASMATGVTVKQVLKNHDMSMLSKLVYVIVHEFAPASYEDICDGANVNLDTAKATIDVLKARGLVTTGVGEANLFWPTYTMSIKPPPKKEEKEAKSTTTSNTDVMLFVRQVEKYYKNRGVNYNISNKGKKHIAKAVEYLNKVWKERDDHPEFAEFELLSDLYYCYIEYTFKNLIDNELNHLKRLIFAGTKGGWRAWMKNSVSKFDPYLIHKSFSDSLYYGIPKKEIPENPADSGYHTTISALLLPKLKSGNYPVASSVLYALECYIIYKMFRKQDVSEMMKVHRQYLKEYKEAEALDRLDDLHEYVTKNKKKSDLCNDCNKKDECKLISKNHVIEVCSEKV